MPKLRAPQGILNNLPVDQRRRLEAWMRQNLTYKAISSLLTEKFGVKVSSGAIYNYYRKFTAKALRDVEVETAAGAEITIRVVKSGEIKLEIRPLGALERKLQLGKPARQKL